MKKIKLTAAIAIALLFTLAFGMASVPSNPTGVYVFGQYGNPPPIW